MRLARLSRTLVQSHPEDRMSPKWFRGFGNDSSKVAFAKSDDCGMIRVFYPITLFQRHFPLEGFNERHSYWNT